MTLGMKRTFGVKRRKISSKNKQPHWLPIDIRLIPDIWSFGHVKGVARAFLELELTFSCLVVFGTLYLVVSKIWP